MSIQPYIQTHTIETERNLDFDKKIRAPRRLLWVSFLLKSLTQDLSLKSWGLPPLPITFGLDPVDFKSGNFFELGGHIMRYEFIVR